MSDQPEPEPDVPPNNNVEEEPNPQAVQSISYKKRRERKPLSRVPRGSPLVGVVNSLILVIGLTLILASRCEQSNQALNQEANWLNHLITPKDLHLPRSVTDKLNEEASKATKNQKIEPLNDEKQDQNGASNSSDEP